jgi:hypothetical protein
MMTVFGDISFNGDLLGEHHVFGDPSDVSGSTTTFESPPPLSPPSPDEAVFSP